MSFWDIIDNDLALHILGRELLIAARYLPMAVRAMFIPAIIVGLIYKVAQYKGWSR